MVDSHDQESHFPPPFFPEMAKNESDEPVRSESQNDLLKVDLSDSSIEPFSSDPFFHLTWF